MARIRTEFGLAPQVGVVFIDSPKGPNTLDASLWSELIGSLRDAETNPSVSVLVLTGTRGRFAAGADVRELADRSVEETLRGPAQSYVDAIASINKPLLAAVGGPALGGGCEIALACDLRIASEAAVFGLPETRLGIIPAGGGTQRLAAIVGEGRALEMVLTGRKVPAHEAMAWGLANEVTEPGAELEVALGVAERIAQSGPLAVRLAKQLVSRWDDAAQMGLLAERLAQAVCFGSPDRLEGIAAFLERRVPDFGGGGSGLVAEEGDS